MKRLLAVLSLAALLAAGSVARADDSPDLLLIRGLRAKGWHDLAFEHLQRVRANNPSPELAAALSLESARIRLDQAAAESNPSERLALFGKARAEFEEFVAKSPGTPAAAEARLDIARIVNLSAKALLARALRPGSTSWQADSEAARKMFGDAREQYKGAADVLQKQLADPKYANPKEAKERGEKRALTQALQQAELDLAVNSIDQAKTLVNEGNLEVQKQRTKIFLDDAIPALKKITVVDSTNPSPVPYIALAWIGYCYHQSGNTPKARTDLADLENMTAPIAAVGRRMARGFLIEIDAELGNSEVVRVLGESWMKEFGVYANTPEGCAVRFHLADAYFKIGQVAKDAKAKTTAYNRARDLCRDLDRIPNEFSEESTVLKIRIIGTEGGFASAVPTLNTFDDCLLRAQYEEYQIAQLFKKKDIQAEEHEKERKAHLATIIQALARGLELIDKGTGPKASPLEVGKARSMLCAYYLFTGKFKEAIDSGEASARVVPPTAQSASTAVYVLQAYSELVNGLIREGTPIVDLEKDPKSPLNRMRELAGFMEATWANDNNGDFARHQLGLLLLKQNKNAEAYDALAKVRPGYNAAIFVKYQMFRAAAQVAKDRSVQANAEPDPAKREQAAKEQKLYEQRSQDALKAAPPLPPGADDTTVFTYLMIKQELAQALFRNKQYADIEPLVEPLLTALEKGDIRLSTKERTDEARVGLNLLKLYSRYGAAAAAFNAKQTAKVKELIDPVLDDLKKGSDSKYSAEIKKDKELRWGMLGLALRVSIQEGNTVRAQEILQILQKNSGLNEDEAGARTTLGALIGLIRAQVQEARKGKKEVYEKTVEGMGRFLDDVVKAQKSPTADLLRMFGDAYAALEKHEKAVEYYRQVPEPAPNEGATEDEKKKLLGNYHASRILIVRSLRLDGKVDEAEGTLKQIRDTPWGKEHIEAQKEFIHLTAARGYPAKAFVEWKKMVDQFANRMNAPGAKDQYFECYYFMVESLTKYAMAQPAGQKRDDQLKRAARFIVDREKSADGLGSDESKARFQDLLDREPGLKEQYDKLNAK